MPDTAGPPRSPTAYWITTPDHDASRRGVSTWAILRDGGSFVVDRCRAPDYALPRDARVPMSLPFARCEKAIDGRIAKLTEDELTIEESGSVRTLRYRLTGKGALERLTLDLDGGVTLAPGARNTLVERLGQLPADQAARSAYLQRMVGTQLGATPR